MMRNIVEPFMVGVDRKFRESRIFDVFTAARLCRTDSAVRGRFCVKRFGP
jgi:hypothetical protein